LHQSRRNFIFESKKVLSVNFSFSSAAMAPQGDDAKVASPETSPHLKPRSCDIVLNPEVSLKIYQLVDLPLMANPRDGAGGGEGLAYSD